jgi:transcription initiation factor TFIIIB Brf1 subunit/transcription initiation factor TFIIB
MPDDDALDIAIEWLTCNEGEGAEGEACKAVARWLAFEQCERTVRTAARAAGVTVAQLRRRLQEKTLTNRTKCPRSE